VSIISVMRNAPSITGQTWRINLKNKNDMSDNSTWVNITELPLHTRLETIFSKYVEAKNKGEGFSIHPTLKKNPIHQTSGYMVARTSKSTAENNPRDVIAELSEIIGGQGELYIGGWLNDQGEYFIELSEWYPSIGLAMLVGKKNNQTHVYSMEEQQPIAVIF